MKEFASKFVMAAALAVTSMLISSASEAQNPPDTSMTTKLRACGAGLTAEAESTFRRALELSGSQLPGRGAANIDTFGFQLNSLLKDLSDDSAKITLLNLYYSCIKPILEDEGTSVLERNQIQATTINGWILRTGGFIVRVQENSDGIIALFGTVTRPVGLARIPEDNDFFS